MAPADGGPVEGDAPELALRRYLAARLGPLGLLLVVVVSVSAPIAFYVLGREARLVEAQTSARQIAEVIRRDAQERPILWKYDSIKLLAHLRSYEVQENIEHIDVVDADGARIETQSTADLELLRRSSVIWQSAPVMVNDDAVGEVWVAAATSDIRGGALALLAPFGLLGLGLAGLMFWLPVRAMRRAESRIGGLINRLGESQGALATLNENLEHQVEQRSSELSRAYRELQQKEQGLREISSRAVRMQEAERRAIARDLHDSAGQALTAIRINLQLLGDSLPNIEQTSRFGDLARRTTKMVDQTVEEIRRAVNTLGPAVLDDVGLAEAVQRACTDFRESMEIDLDLNLEVPEDPIPAAIETTCYRVVQESLTNVSRHAAPSHVEVRLRVQADRAAVQVIDDGRGFDPQQVGGLSRGLAGMRERVELLGGTLTIDSEPGQGTRVSVDIPYAQAPAVERG